MVEMVGDADRSAHESKHHDKSVAKTGIDNYAGIDNNKMAK